MEYEDEQFEKYLSEFEPRRPRALPGLVFPGLVWTSRPPAVEPRHQARRSIVLGAWAVTATVILALGAFTLHVLTNRARVAEIVGNVGNPEHLQAGQPLTMRSANALMARAPSFRAMVDDMAFRLQTVPLPKGKRSAVAVLGKEKIKL